MFTIIGTSVGFLLSTIGIATNLDILGDTQFLICMLTVLLMYLIYMSIGAFIGMIVDIILGLLKNKRGL